MIKSKEKKKNKENSSSKITEQLSKPNAKKKYKSNKNLIVFAQNSLTNKDREKMDFK